MNLILMLYCKTGHVAQSSVRDLSSGIALLFPEETGIEAVKILKETSFTYSKDLKQRVSKEMPDLPFPRYYAILQVLFHSHVDFMNMKYPDVDNTSYPLC